MRCGGRSDAVGGNPVRGRRLERYGAAGVVKARNCGPGYGRPGFLAPVSSTVPGPVGARRCRRNMSCQGAVTAEFAVALPAVLLLLALLLAGAAAGVTQIRLEGAARAGARALVRGEDAATADGIVRRLAGESATSAVDSDGEWLTVTVSARVAGAVGSLVPWTLTARAWARGESLDSPVVSLLRRVPEGRSPGRTA